MRKFLEKKYKLVILFVLAFMFIVSALNAANDSAIFDETAHIGAAYSYVSQQEMRLNPEHPPLIKDLAGLPLLFMNLNFDTTQPFWTGDLPGKWDEGQWAAGKSLLYYSGNDADRIIFWSRVPIILISLLLGFFIFRWTREMAGLSAGIFALILYAFDPNILGHNHFVTTDIGIAAFFTFSFYYYLKFIKHPNWKNVLLAGIFLGLLQLAKFSSIIGFPVLALVTILYPLIIHAPEGIKNNFTFRAKKIGEYVGKGALVFLISIIVVWIVYAINTFHMSQSTISRAIDNNFSPADTQNAKNVYTNKILHTLNNNSLTRPLSEYGIGMGYVFRRVAGGNGVYYMGEVSGTAFKSYFPTVFAIKEPLPSLILMLSALLVSIIGIAKSLQKIASPEVKNHWSELFSKIVEFLRGKITVVALFIFIILYSYVSITGNLNIGFRHLFPILPFIYILTARSISIFIESASNHSRKTLRLIVLAILVALVAGTVFAYPSYMSYFNQIAGGPKNGYHYATDSNADWGQDLKRLRNWVDNFNDKCSNGFGNDKGTACYRMINSSAYDPMQNNLKPIDKIRVDYFGGGDIRYYLGDKYVMWWDAKRPIEPGWYAVSTNFLQGSIYSKTKTDEDSYRWILKYKPVYQVGTSLLIYNIN